MDLIGYGLATLALVFFGLYMVPRKLTGFGDRPFVLSMSVGILLSTTLPLLLAHHTLLPRVAPASGWPSPAVPCGTWACYSTASPCPRWA